MINDWDYLVQQSKDYLELATFLGLTEEDDRLGVRNAKAIVAMDAEYKALIDKCECPQ